MGFGVAPAGLGPAGSDPVADPSNPAATEHPSGVAFDLRTRRHVLKPNGAFKGVHWVDEAMVFACGFFQGSLPCAPEIGNSTNKILLGDGVQTAAEVRDRVQSAPVVQQLLNDGLVEILSIDVAEEPYGRLEWAIRYINVVTQQERVARSNEHG